MVAFFSNACKKIVVNLIGTCTFLCSLLPIMQRDDNEQRDLLPLVLRSRKALDGAKTLCMQADTLVKGSIQLAVDLLAVDAKVTWVLEGIQDQLKVYISFPKVFKTIHIRALVSWKYCQDIHNATNKVE